VLVGAPFRGANAGAVYLFSTNGALLTTITNPTPTMGDLFGWAIVMIGSDRMLIAAPGGPSAGVAHLFKIQPDLPTLSILHTITNTVVISWPLPSTGFVLQQNANIVSSVGWSNVANTIYDDGTNRMAIINAPTENQFFRLFKE
jgi:hypothetical protein